MRLTDKILTTIEEVRGEQKVNCPPLALREFAIAITELESASWRIARGQALKQGESVHPDQLTLLTDESRLADTA